MSISKATIIIIIVLLLTLTLPINALADDPEPTPIPTYSPEDIYWAEEINNYTAADAVYHMLAAIGIEIVDSNAGGFTGLVQNYIIDELTEFVATLPSVSTISQLILPWRFGTDQWGNFVGNSSFIEDVNDFTIWLTNKYGLADNMTILVNGGYNLNGISVYNSGYMYPSTIVYRNGNDNRLDLVVQINSNSNHPFRYIVWHDSNASMEGNYNQGYYAVAFTADGTYWNEQVTYGMYRADGTVVNSWSRWVNLNVSTNTGIIWDGMPDTAWYAYFDGFYIWVPAGAVILDCTASELETFMTNAVLSADGLSLRSETITLPEDDIDYSTGDSVSIVSGQPEYGYIEWPESITVDNYPTVIVKTTIQNPGFNEAWHYVEEWQSEVEDSNHLAMYTFADAPRPVRLFLYSIITLALIMGFLKLVKQH